MKDLNLNPQKYETELGVGNVEMETKDDYGLASVRFRFGDVSGEQCFTRPELEQIGKWFLNAAKSTLPKPKRKVEAKARRK